MIDRLTLDTEPWLSCDDCFEQVDEVVEQVVATGSTSESFRVHLVACPACPEETFSLASLVGLDRSVDGRAASQKPLGGIVLS